MLSREERVTMLLPSQLVTQEASYSDYHDAIVRALACRRTMLDVALAQFTTRAMVLTEVAARLIEALRSGHKILVAGNGGVLPRHSTLRQNW